jgi:hypothetical protein
VRAVVALPHERRLAEHRPIHAGIFKKGAHRQRKSGETRWTTQQVSRCTAGAEGTRGLIENGDGKTIWGTVGVSDNIIEASSEALRESVDFKLSLG